MKIQKFIFMMLTVLLTIPQALAISLNNQALVYESYAAERKYDYNKASEIMSKVLHSNSKDYFTHLRLGYLFSYSKKYKNSVNHYETAAKIAPESTEPWTALSLLYLNIGDPENALTASNQLLKIDSKNYYGTLRKGSSLIRLKKYSEALPVVEEGLAHYPSDLTFLEQKGFLLKSLGKDDEAKEILSYLLLLSPQNSYAKSILAK